MPDVHLAARGERDPLSRRPAHDADVAEPIVLETFIAEPIKESSLEIVDSRSRLVVTVIALLSPPTRFRKRAEAGTGMLTRICKKPPPAYDGCHCLS